MLKIIRIVFYSILLLFLLDIFELFQTKINFLKVLIYYSILLLPLPLLVIEFIANRNVTKAILRKTIPLLAIFGLLFLNPVKLLFHTQTWKTQTVTVINENNKNHKVEFQKKAIGALGYAKRKAEIYYVTKYFHIVLSVNK